MNKLLRFLIFTLLLTSTCLSQTANQPSDLIVCDDNNDGLAQFDLTIQDAQILGGQNPSDYSLTYHLSQSEADSAINPIANPSNFTNINNPQTIYVRIEDTSTGSFETTSFNVYVNPIPIIQLEDVYTICNGNSLILDSGLSDLDHDFSWSTGETTPTITITQAGSYSLTVIDFSTGCSSTDSTTVVIDGNLPSTQAPSNFITCLDAVEYNLELKIPEVLNGQDPNLFIISFYTNLADLDNNVNEIIDVNAFGTYNDITIYVKIKDTTSDCYSIESFEIILGYCPTIITCGEGPVNTSYCYTNDDTSQFIFESSDESTLTVAFNSGEIEVDYDQLIIYDTNGAILNPDNIDGDLTGLYFTSTGKTLTVEIISDYSVSCSNSSFQDIEALNFDVYCTSDFKIIKVNAFLDNNSNGVFDSNEINFTNGYFTYQVNDQGTINTVSSSTGSFNIFPDYETDSYDISFYLYDEYVGCFTVSNSNFENITVTNGNMVILDFPLTDENTCEDLAVYLINYTNPPRPGFNFTNYLIIENLGYSTISSGTIEFVSDDLINVSNVSANSIVYNITYTANGFLLDFNNLQPGQTEEFEVLMYCPPSVALGEEVINTATYTTVSNDLFLDNNYSELTQTVVGSYDPNDKLESHGQKIEYIDFIASDEYLYYTIRFQNIGTAEAINVKIRDVLNSQLDFNTFQMLSSSHDVVLTKSNSVLTWQFDNINLPSENQDEPKSHGFVYFKIQPNSGYSVGSIIPNTASITFDFNSPIITNTFETEFVQTLSIDESSQSMFQIFPNPAKNELNIKFNTRLLENTFLEVFDIQGKLIMSKQEIENSYENRVDVSALQAGMYFVVIKTNSFKEIKKIVIE